jgi:prolyl-tRNA synthetase
VFGNIFSLGKKFSEALGLTFKDENGDEKPVIMGSYGIGPARAMGTIVEILSDEKGIVWPRSVAPFAVHVVSIGEDEAVRIAADTLYVELSGKNIEVLYDDRDIRAGEKFADSDLLGLPFRIVVSTKNLESGMFEVVERATGKVEMLTKEALYERV